MSDQAERLRRLAQSYKTDILAPRKKMERRARVVAVASGKGGVGKTNLAVNLAYALISLGREVILMDGDLGLANIDVLLGITPTKNLAQVASGEAQMLDVIYAAPGDLKVVVGGQEIEDPSDMPEADLHRFIQALRKLEDQSDYLIMDTGAGVGKSVTNFVLAADIVLLVATPEPTAITDAYAMIKAVVRRNPAADIRLVINQAGDEGEAAEAAQRLTSAALRFLGCSVDYLGHIPVDREVARAVRTQQPFFQTVPRSSASQAVLTLARRLNGDSDQESSVRGVGLFFDRLARIFMKRR